MSEVSGGKVNSPVLGGSNQDEWYHQAFPIQEASSVGEVSGRDDGSKDAPRTEGIRMAPLKDPIFWDVQKTGSPHSKWRHPKRKRRVEPRRYNNSVAGSSHCEQLINPGDIRPKGRPACIEAWWGHWNLWIFVRVTCRFDPCCLRATPEDLSRFW